MEATSPAVLSMPGSVAELRAVYRDIRQVSDRLSPVLDRLDTMKAGIAPELALDARNCLFALGVLVRAIADELERRPKGGSRG